MAKDTNRAYVVGNLTKDAVLKITQDNKKVASFTLASNRWNEGADYINFVAWEKLAEVMEKYTKKGDRVLAEGRIQTRTYDDASGKKVYVTEVVCDSVQLLESKRDNDKALEEVSMDYVIEEAPTLDISSDELPF